MPYADAAKVVSWADQHGLGIEPGVRTYADGSWKQELQAMALSTASRLPAGCGPPKVTGLVSPLLPTQEVAIHAAARAWVTRPGKNQRNPARALLVADEPGLGKTVIALATLRIAGLECLRPVIVCPTSLTANWQAEMSQHFEPGEFRPWVAKSLTPTPVPDDCNAVIIGWDVLQAWVDTLIEWHPDAVIADEGHYAKSGKQRNKETTEVVRDTEGKAVRDEHGNLQIKKTTKKVGGSARATALLDLGATASKNHGIVMALTGTPIVNRPLELMPLLEFVGCLHLFGGKTNYQQRYCDPKQVTIQGRTRWNYQGASHLMELNARLAASGHYVRRTKQTLIEGGIMRPKYVDGVYIYDHTTQPNPWVIDAADAEMAGYRAAEDQTTEFFRGRAREIADDLRAQITSAKVKAKVASEGGQSKHLKRIATLRQEAAKVKVAYVVEKVRALVDQGEKVVIAAHHRDIVNAYASAFTGLKIQGDMGAAGIEKAKGLFNETPTHEHPVLVLSVEAGKTGHTLCKQAIHGIGLACAYMVFAEQVWTPGDETQAQDRIWRIGQDREVRIVNALLQGSIDMSMYAQRAKKRAVVDAAVDAVDPDARAKADDEKDGRGALIRTLVYGK